MKKILNKSLQKSVEDLTNIIDLCKNDLDNNNKNVAVSLDYENLKSLQTLLKYYNKKSYRWSFKESFLYYITYEYLSKDNDYGVGASIIRLKTDLNSKEALDSTVSKLISELHLKECIITNFILMEE